MLARLWWKEYRAFGPIWLLLGGVAVGLQWFLLSMGGEDFRSGALTVVALGWASLYAFAAGSAAFAGERESNTMGFLDALPVDRRTLWAGKATFALASTVGLALVLAALAALGTERRDPGADYGYGRLVPGFALLAGEALAWGLFWSSLSRNTLLAGAMSVVSVAAVFYVGNEVTPLAASSVWIDRAFHAATATAALVASAWLVARRSTAWWSPRARAASDGTRSIEARRSSAARVLAWQTWREGRTTAVLVATVGLVVPIGASLMGMRPDGLLDVLLAVMASLVAGVAVFGTENASGSRRFLAHHGVGPGTVWATKVLAWGVGMAAFLGLFLLSSARYGSPFVPGPFGRPEDRWVPLLMAVVDAFAVGVVFGMAIRRRITAALVGVIVLVAIVPPQVGLSALGMIPGWSLLLVPLILLAASRAWAGDWLLDRDGAREWARLGSLLVVPFALLGMAFVAYRAWGLPDVGPQSGPAAIQAGVVPPDRDAASLYRGAGDVIRPWGGPAGSRDGRSTLFDEIIERGWDPRETGIIAWWEQNRAAIDLARRASAMPAGPFEAADRMTYASGEDQAVENLRRLASMLALDTRERLSRGDLPGAWEDILAQFRMANQLTAASPTMIRVLIAANVHHLAVGLAFDWLGDGHQSPETIRRALGDLKALPPLPTMAESLRVESAILDRTLDLSGEDLARIVGSMMGGGRQSVIEHLVFVRLIAPPWERMRARRVCRRLVAESLPIVEVEPWRRPAGYHRLDANEVQQVGSPLVRLLYPAIWSAVAALDREVVGRRVLVLAVAVKSWQASHDGKYPETLEALVPGELDRLPLDPDSGQRFRYIRSEGQPVRPPILSDFGSKSQLRPTRPGQPLIYGVGPDGKDDGGKDAYIFNIRNNGDYLFAVP